MAGYRQEIAMCVRNLMSSETLSVAGPTRECARDDDLRAVLQESRMIARYQKFRIRRLLYPVVRLPGEHSTLRASGLEDGYCYCADHTERVKRMLEDAMPIVALMLQRLDHSDLRLLQSAPGTKRADHYKRMCSFVRNRTAKLDRITAKLANKEALEFGERQQLDAAMGTLAAIVRAYAYTGTDPKEQVRITANDQKIIQASLDKVSRLAADPYHATYHLEKISTTIEGKSHYRIVAETMQNMDTIANSDVITIADSNFSKEELAVYRLLLKIGRVGWPVFRWLHANTNHVR